MPTADEAEANDIAINKVTEEDETDNGDGRPPLSEIWRPSGKETSKYQSLMVRPRIRMRSASDQGCGSHAYRREGGPTPKNENATARAQTCSEVGPLRLLRHVMSISHRSDGGVGNSVFLN